MNLNPLFPDRLADKLEQIYRSEIDPLLREKVKELTAHGENLLNLAESESESFSDKLKKWCAAMFFWHKQKTIRITKATDITIKDKVPADLVERFVKRNVEMITDLSQTIRQTDFRPVMESIIQKGREVSAKTLADEIINETGTAKSKAKFWARDQVATLNSQIDQEKYKANGITHYIWLAGQDGRTRASHREKHGKVFSLNDEGTKPGEEYNCRCSMKPATLEEIQQGGLDPKQVERAKKRWEQADLRKGIIDGVKYEEVKDVAVDKYVIPKKIDEQTKKAIETYSSGKGYAINDYKRFDKAISEELKQHTEVLERYLEGHELTKPIRLKRTIVAPPASLENLKVGDMFEDEGFVSCTTGNYLLNSGIKLNIFVPPGTVNGAYIGEQSLLKSEREFLFNTAVFDIIGVDEKTKTYTVKFGGHMKPKDKALRAKKSNKINNEVVITREGKPYDPMDRFVGKWEEMTILRGEEAEKKYGKLDPKTWTRIKPNNP